MSPTAHMGSEANSERAKVQQFQYNDEIITLFFGNSNVILYVFLLECRDAENKNLCVFVFNNKKDNLRVSESLCSKIQTPPLTPPLEGRGAAALPLSRGGERLRVLISKNTVLTACLPTLLPSIGVEINAISTPDSLFLHT